MPFQWRNCLNTNNEHTKITYIVNQGYGLENEYAESRDQVDKRWAPVSGVLLYFEHRSCSKSEFELFPNPVQLITTSSNA